MIQTRYLAGLLGFAMLSGCALHETPTKTLLLQASRDPDLMKRVKIVDQILAEGPSAEPELVKAMYDSDPLIRKQATLALAHEPDKFSEINVSEYVAEYPPSQEYRVQWMLGQIAKEKTPASLAVFERCVATRKPNKEAVDQFCIGDPTGVATLVRAGKLPVETIDVIRRFAKKNSCKEIQDALNSKGSRRVAST